MTIGRGETADVKLEDRTVSRLHARIDATAQGPMISDAGSRFGVTVAGQKLSEPRRLTAGTEIRLGNVTLRVESALAASAAPWPVGRRRVRVTGRRPTPPSSCPSTPPSSGCARRRRWPATARSDPACDRAGR